ncbi:MAG: DUF433 domain-containing protein [Nitrospiraceae bacterium]|nr:MAG: DUF433 domain-containing protein [Nitrospiraceae bacterium]
MTLNEHRPDLLALTPEGSIRITGTRIAIESIIQSFRDGATSEEICQDFPALSLAQVYDVLAFYLTYQAEVESYLRQQIQDTAVIRQKLQTQHAAFLSNLRQRLATRRSVAAPHA